MAKALRATRIAVMVALATITLVSAPSSAIAVSDIALQAHALVATPSFSATRAMAHIKRLTSNGPRKAGSSAERKAAEYAAAQLRSYGYTVRIQKVKIPYGRTSRNVIAEKPGTSGRVIVIGAHIDSKVPAPGGNDNASGVAVMLEEARILRDAELAPTVRFIAFGAEEKCGKTSRDHHFGSRRYVKSLSTAERAQISGMVSVDMVGYGSVFNVRNMKRAPMTVVKSLQAHGKTHGEKLVFLKDYGADGWSDHEPFEMKGIPSAWLEWRYDPKCHTKGDTYKHVSSKKIARSGKLMRTWLLGLTEAKLVALRP